MSLHGGSISASSQGEGKGCTFAVELVAFLTTENLEEGKSDDNADVESIRMTAAAVEDAREVASQRVSGGSGRLVDCEHSCAVEEGSVAAIHLSGNDLQDTLKDQQRDEVFEFKVDEVDNGVGSVKTMTGACSSIVSYEPSVSHVDRISHSDVDPSSTPLSHPVSVSVSVSSKPGVLLVDDAAMVRKMMRRTLCDDFSVTEAEDGAVAVTRVSSAMRDGLSYDLVLMDYQMPNMSGPAAAKAMREMGYRGLIVGLTGNVLAEDVAFYESMGANKVFGKPVKEDDLEQVLAMVADARHH